MVDDMGENMEENMVENMGENVEENMGKFCWLPRTNVLQPGAGIQ